ncbi:MAG TPA: gas vesicle protein [Candidatus Tectomicrobia bacterium]|nr:gas vesicle protein [Candidatus Tectomicrobia bacterium]
MRTDLPLNHGRASTLVDVLDRVLDKGLVVAGDVKISLAEVELLTIRIRLIVCSIDKAEQIGLDWWRHDGYLAPGRNRIALENETLRKEIRALERRVAVLSARRDNGRRLAPRETRRLPRRPPDAR